MQIKNALRSAKVSRHSNQAFTLFRYPL